MDESLIKVVRKIYGNSIKSSEARGFYEVSSPTTQCNNIIGKFENGIECYICGMKINRHENKNGKMPELIENEDNIEDTDKVDGRNPECEHILPIILAVIWLGLASPKFKNNPWYDKDILKYEYAWAHRTCNQLKSDKNFIVLEDNRFKINKLDLKKLLNNIWDSTRKDSKKFIEELHNLYAGKKDASKKDAGKKDTDNKQEFIKNRLNYDSLLIQKFKDITNYLNSFNAPNLLLLAGVTKAVEGPKSAKAANILATHEHPDVRNEKERERERQRGEEANKLYDDLVHSVIQDMTSLFNRGIYKTIYNNFLNTTAKEKDKIIKKQQIPAILYNELTEIFVQSVPYNMRRRISAKKQTSALKAPSPNALSRTTRKAPSPNTSAAKKATSMDIDVLYTSAANTSAANTFAARTLSRFKNAPPMNIDAISTSPPSTVSGQKRKRSSTVRNNNKKRARHTNNNNNNNNRLIPTNNTRKNAKLLLSLGKR